MPTANIRSWMKRLRHDVGRHACAVFGSKGDGCHTWGTGILVDFRGTPVILSCAHVVGPIVGTVFVTTARRSRQTDPVYRSSPIVDSALDWACLVVRDRGVFEQKSFVAASEIFLGDVNSGEAVLVHGFPVAHKALQVGGAIDAARGEARFNSMTYLSLTAAASRNETTQLRQPRIEWSASGNLDSKSFRPLKRNLVPKERGGVSGGPVFLANSLRLCGQVTHASDSHYWYNPMGNVLSALDGRW